MPHPVLLPAAGPAEDLLRKVIVSGALQALSPAHREVLNETILRDRTVNEAAEVLGIPVGTVKLRVYDAVRALRLILNEFTGPAGTSGSPPDRQRKAEAKGQAVSDDAGAAFDAIADGYDDNDEHARIADALIRLVEPVSGGFAIDVATGTGAAAFAALRMLRLARIAAVDISAGMLHAARRRAAAEDPGCQIRWLRGSAVPLPMAGSSADLVLCASSLHFLGPSALGDWHRVLRPGGVAAFSLPAASSFQPSPQFRRLLPVPGILLPDSPDDAGNVLFGTGLSLLRAMEFTLNSAGRRVILIAAVRV